jgi:N-acetylmuramoyl-L-alanine amidase
VKRFTEPGLVKLRLAVLALAMLVVCTNAHSEPYLQLGDIAEIQVKPGLNVSVVVNLRGRDVDEVARNMLANRSDARTLTRGNRMTIPFENLSDPYKAIVAMRIFPNDSLTDAGVQHVVSYDDESLRRVAEIYTGSADNAASMDKSGTVGEVSITRNHRILVTINRIDVPDVDALAQAVLNDPTQMSGFISGQSIAIDARELKDVYRGQALNHLFHQDIMTEDARRHKVVLNIETLFRIALWFTGDGNNWRTLKRASNKRRDAVALRETIVIPRGLLGSYATVTEDDVAALTRGYPLALTSRSNRGEMERTQRLLVPRRLVSSWTRHMEGGEDAAQDAVDWFVYRGQKNGPITYGADQDGGYALYRLKRGQALYSSVVVKFTGVMTAEEVLATANDLLRRSGYRDPRRLPVGARIKIPMDMLIPDWRPANDPARIADSRENEAVRAAGREITQEFAARRQSGRTRRPLDGVTVILDAGHGGRDPGALGNGGLTENEVVYDILCRVRKLLRDETSARVAETIKDTRTKYNPSSSRVIRDNRNEVLLTNPRYDNSNVVTSANLRWYLANALVRQAANDNRSMDKVVFTSFHADALHSSVRGAMIYIPSARHTAGRYTAKRSYRRYREVQQRPVVSYSSRHRIRAQALSTRFAKQLVTTFQSSRIAIHTPKTIRGYIIRSRRSRPWVPAIIRYNAAPTKVLVEIGNIRNTSDAANMKLPAWRQRFARAYVDALIAAYGS